MPEPARILIVDDDPAMCALLEMILELEGFACRAAEDLTSARSLLGSDLGLVLLDLTIGDVDGGGAALLLEIRSRTDLAAVPVLCVSGHIDPVMEQQCREAGAIGFVKKPFKREDLAAEVHRILGRQRELARAVQTDAR